LIDANGRLTAVGDHRQSIYGFRGADVDIIAQYWEKFKQSDDSEVVDLRENFRSTLRIITLANKWADTISRMRSMETPAMTHGNRKRIDQHCSHVAIIDFSTRTEEAAWIGDAVRVLVPSEIEGALHDKRDGSARGLTMSDIAVLVRSSTDVRTYTQALEAAGIPCVVRAGPDLFSQPEILFFISALAISAGCAEFYGSRSNPKSLPNRIKSVLGCTPEPCCVLKQAAQALRQTGLAFERDVEDRIFLASRAVYKRMSGKKLAKSEIAAFRTPKLREFLASGRIGRRIFPQRLYHLFLSEAEVEKWDTFQGRGQSALFHLGALSGLITGIETPGWTSIDEYRWLIIGLCQYGAEEGRLKEQPLMVQPEAVTVSTIHAVKGLEFAVVFLADVNPRRFPSNCARHIPDLPLDGSILQAINIQGLADNENHDGERRLMYVALTRSERFLFISHSGPDTSKFIKELKAFVRDSGGMVTDNGGRLLEELKYAPKEHRRDFRLSTSFSDLRYYLECPHDFYLRKVLGFSPTIDQVFGYGRGVHNLIRAINADPKRWAALAHDRAALESELEKLVQQGLFYLRYTTGRPARIMQAKAVKIAADYIRRYAAELETLKFEPEKEFETFIEYDDGQGGALIAGTIDVVRQDRPPRVTLIDFKSGDPDSDQHQKLDEEEMQLQVSLYAVAAKKELEYQPEKGLVRYLDADEVSKAELSVALDDASLAKARDTVARAAAKIRDRQFHYGPWARQGPGLRCAKCDFLGICGMKEAVAFKARTW